MTKFIFIGIIIVAILGFYFYYKFNNQRPIEIQQELLKNMKISSLNFGKGEFIPQKFTCDGQDISPEIRIEGAPPEAKSLVLIVDDPDAPAGTWTHWIVWNIPADTKIIYEGKLPEGAKEGKTDFGRSGYGGPCPPPGKPHRYFFKIYALDSDLDLDNGASRQELEQLMAGHILDQAEFFGLYQRK